MSEPDKALVPRPPAPELDGYMRLGQWLAASEVENPNEVQRQAAAALRVYFAEALELPPLAASELSVIRGRLVVSAKLLRALAARSGYRIVKVESSERSCTARLLKDGELIGETTFTIEDAARANLVKDRGGYKTHPARMLWARASKFVIDDFAPEVSLGLLTEDEAIEITAEVVPEPPPMANPDLANKSSIPEDEPPAEFLNPPLLDEKDPSEQETFIAPQGKRGAGGKAEDPSE